MPDRLDADGLTTRARNLLDRIGAINEDGVIDWSIYQDPQRWTESQRISKDCLRYARRHPLPRALFRMRQCGPVTVRILEAAYASAMAQASPKAPSECPICGRQMCDHTCAERGQTYAEMMGDPPGTHPHIERADCKCDGCTKPARPGLIVWQDPESLCWRLRTDEGEFVLYPEDGGLRINGTGPTDARKHDLTIAVEPLSGNAVAIHYRRRSRDA